MSWSTTDTVPDRKWGPIWTTTDERKDRLSLGGWYATVGRLAPRIVATGTLSATVKPYYPFNSPHFDAEGSLSVSVRANHAIAARFTGIGSLYAEHAGSRFILAQFRADGAYGGGINDGLTAVVSPALAARFSGGGDLAYVDRDGLSAIVIIGSIGAAAQVAAYFAGGSTLAVGAHEADGLTASIYGVVAAPAITAAFSGAGSLTATVVHYLMAQGSLTATIVGGFPTGTVAAPFTAAGSLSATVTPKFIYAAALSGGATLSATVVGRPSVPVSAPLAGSGTLSATVVGRIWWWDDFNRANSTTGLGPNWVQRFNVTGINNNAAYPNWFNSWCLASPKALMTADDGEASIVLGPLVGSGSDGKMVGLGFNEAGQGAFVYHDGGTIYIFSQVDWAQNWTPQVNAASTIPTGGTLTIKRVGNVYTGLVNGAVHVTWTDSGNLIPRDVNHRLLDFAVYTPDSANWRTVDYFGATAIPKPDVDIYADNFNRANASTLGSGWTTRLREPSIVSNAAHPTLVDWNVSTPNVVMSGDDVESSVIYAPGTRTHTLLGLGFNNAGTNGAFLYYNGDNSNYNWINQTSWGAGWTNQGTTIAGPTLVTGDKLTNRRIGNQYFALVNGKQVHTWIDTGGIITRDANNRIPTLGMHTDGTNYRDYDSFDTAVVVGDNFNRANSTTSAGPLWTNRWASMGISSNSAYAASAGDWCQASANVLMPSDDIEVSIVVGAMTSAYHTIVGLGHSASGEGSFLYTDGYGGWNIFKQNTWDAGNWGGMASISTGPTPVAGDTLTFRRVGNLYTTLINGVAQVSWADTGNVIPRDANHRMVMFALYPGSYLVDSFSARSL